MRSGDLPASIHLTVTASVAPRVGEFAADLAVAAGAARALGPPALPPEVVGLVATLDPETLTPDLVASLAAGLGLTLDGRAPLSGRQAMINALLDAAPPPVREGLLVAVLGLLQRPSW